MRPFLLLLTFLGLSGLAFAGEPLEVAAFETSVSPTASINNVLAISAVQDETLGFEISYERLLSKRWSWRAFGEARNRGYYSNPAARRVGGGLGLRTYWFRTQPLAGIFLDFHASGFNVFDPYMAAYGGYGNGNDPIVHTLYGGGLTFGWQIPLADRVRLSPSFRTDWLFSDQEKQYFNGLGRISAEVLIYLGYAF